MMTCCLCANVLLQDGKKFMELAVVLQGTVAEILSSFIE